MNCTPLSPVHVATSTSPAGIIIARTLASTTSRFCLSRLPGAGPFDAAPPDEEPEAGCPALPADAALDAEAAFAAEAADAAAAACCAAVGGGGSLVRSTLLPFTFNVVELIGTARSKMNVVSPHSVRIVVVGPAALTPSLAIAAWISFIAAALAVSMSSTVRGALVETTSTGVASERYRPG